MALFEAYEDQIQETLRGLEEKLDKAAKMHAGVLAFPPHSLMQSTQPSALQQAIKTPFTFGGIFPTPDAEPRMHHVPALSSRRAIQKLRMKPCRCAREFPVSEFVEATSQTLWNMSLLRSLADRVGHRIGQGAHHRCKTGRGGGRGGAGEDGDGNSKVFARVWSV